MLRASYRDGLADVSQVSASWQGATLRAEGRAPLSLFAQYLPAWLLRTAPVVQSNGHLSARFEALTPAMLAPWVAATTLSQVSGQSSGTLTLEADAPTIAGVRAELVLDRAELSVAGVRFDAGRPARFDLTDGWLQIVDWEWGGEGHELSLGGGAQLDDGPTLDLWADGLIDLRVLGAFLPRVSTAGRALLSAQVTGTARAPQFAGHIDLQRGDIRLADPQIIVSDLDGRLLFARDELTIADLRGSANGGTLSVTGRVGYAGLQPTDGRLSVQGRGMALSLPDPLKTEADANLSLGIEHGVLSLAGEVTVLRGSYRQPLSIAGGLLQVLQQLEASVEDEDPSMIDTMALDVRIATAEDIMVDNNYARLALGADLRLRGTVARPVLAGRAEAREGGRIFLGGNVYQLVGNGAIDFADPSRIVPDLNITAEARVSGYEVTLTLKGTPIRLETTLSSYPPLGQADIVSLLVTGRVQADSRPLPTIGREQMLAYLSGEVFGVAGRAVGLDTLRIEPGGSVRFDAGLIATETNPGSRLTFGKQVTRDVDVVFSHNLKENGNFTWIVAYRPRSNVEVRIVSDDSNDRLYGFRHDVTVGGLTVSPPTGRLAPPRVGAVRLVGDSEKLGPGLRGRLSLTAGRSFDFFRWQQDRDKLERFCRDAGYLEARIVARRLPLASAAASRVDLEYDVQLGRRTIVDISGLPRSTGLRREVEALWSRSVFDAFLTDEATKTARSRLIGEGYLRATVAASIESLDAAREKHLVLRIDRGPRSDRWRLALSGNVAVGSDRLLALARARGLEKAAWMDAEPLERALTALYRDEGFLSATVATHAPVFEGREATLPVTIDEGPMFRVDRVEFAGAESQGVEELRAAFGLRPGAVFTRASSAEAARALGDFYRGRGFSNANVAVTSRTNRSAGTVTLAVEVNEGSRQVLRDLVVEGRHRTSTALVSRELRLNVGEPVDPSRWAQARKRLYDTGVFRQVDLEAQPVSAEPDGQLSAVEQPVRAHVTLEEWPPLRLRYGLEVDDSLAPASAGRRLRPGVAGDLTYRGLFGRAASAGLAARFANDFRAARSFVTARSFLGRSLTSNLFLARSRETIGSSARPIVTEKSEFTFEQLFRERRPLQLAYGYRFERNHTFNRAARPDDPFAYDLTVNVARLTATGLIDTRDDLVDATRGHFFSSTFEYGASVLGSDIRFAKQFIQESYFRSLGRRLVFATSGRLGLAAGFGQDLIPSEQFFAGGGNSVRGYGEATLGPRDLFGGATGGNALLILNEELRFPIAWRLRGVLFLDGGNAFATIGQLTPADLRTGVGLGVRVQTPFALLRVDLGTPLDRRAGESRVRWFVSIGQIF